ncbi:hypothetical protein AXG93_3340s1140 [Marchantia polymorpha subsp. ruderalis]|uniref:CCHC-type domain-containing protein n=1 Tax=Marchantia polymorpha subsp. ruderalis TaxID=1480154 RepID=A0A176VSR4_MARPO|nr:hypothetical protein AXG93_3340s1140 [Marchantia polymorpha subsp. ruderalis]
MQEIAVVTQGGRERWSSTRDRDARRLPVRLHIPIVSRARAGTRACGVVAVVPVGELVITEEFGSSVEDRGGFTRSGLRYRHLILAHQLRSLQEFERKTGESLREAYTRMRRLISVTHGVTEAQAVQYWYRILDRELRRRVRDATLLSDASPTLAYVFALSEKIELNIVEERVVTSSFARDAATTSRVPQSTAQSRPFGGGSGGGRGVQTRHQTAARDTGARALVPSFAGQQQGPACWTCGGDHLRRDCPQEAGEVVVVMLLEVEVAVLVEVVEVPV